jgi:hypothetical protein
LSLIIETYLEGLDAHSSRCTKLQEVLQCGLCQEDATKIVKRNRVSQTWKNEWI